MKKIFFAAALAGAAMLASCGGNKGGVQLGSLSEFDSLSYSLGANIGYGMSYEMKDIPFDFKAVDKLSLIHICGCPASRGCLWRRRCPWRWGFPSRLRPSCRG